MAIKAALTGAAAFSIKHLDDIKTIANVELGSLANSSMCWSVSRALRANVCSIFHRGLPIHG
jgi:hypothetical protein